MFKHIKDGVISLLCNTTVIGPLRNIIGTKLMFKNNRGSLLSQLLIFHV